MFLLEEMETDVVQSDAVFLEDVTGLMEATLDAEVSWNNIMMTAVNKEYTAIKNEDAALLEATQTGWWDSVKKWFADRVAELKKFVSTIIKKVVDYFDFAGSFVEKHKEAIAKFDGKVKVSTNTWKKPKGTTSVLEQVMSKADQAAKTAEGLGSGDKVLSTDELSKKVFGVSFDQFSKNLVKTVRGDAKKDTVYDASKVKEMADVCRTARANKQKLSTSFDLSIRVLEQGAKIADVHAKQAKQSGAKEDEKAIKNKIATTKNAVVLVNKAKSTSVSLYNQLVSDALRVVKKAVGGTKKEKEVKTEGTDFVSTLFAGVEVE